MVGVGHPVDDDAELGTSPAVADEHEAVVGGQVHHVDQVTASQGNVPAGLRVDDVAPTLLLRAGRGDCDDQPVAMSQPGAERRVVEQSVLVGIAVTRSAGHPTGMAAVRTHHPHLAPHPAAGGHGNAEPLTVR